MDYIGPDIYNTRFVIILFQDIVWKGKEGRFVGFRLNHYLWYAEETTWLFNQPDYF